MVPIDLFLLLLCSFIIVSDGAAVKPCLPAGSPLSAVQIIPMLTPYEFNSSQMQISIYYYHPEFELSDKIVLVKDDTNQSKMIIAEYYTTKHTGIIHTEVFPIPLPRHYSKYIPQSAGYCAYWERNKNKSELFCLKTNPTWMNDMKSFIGDQNLSSIIIPGTHQSGSYSKKYPQSVISRFSSTQDKDVLEQLIYGARYLDLRIEYYREEYYIAHGPLRLKPLAIILQHIKEFLNNTREIVIVSFRQSSRGFSSSEHHRYFADYLFDELREHLLPRSHKLWNISLNEIWKSNQRLIITHDHDIYKNRPYVWPPINQIWGYVPPSQSLKKFLAVAELSSFIPKITIAAYSILECPPWYDNSDMLYPADTPSLRNLAISVSFDITQAYNEHYFRNARIVAVDYIQFTGIVDVAIQWNKRKWSQCYDQFSRLMSRMMTNHNGTVIKH